MYRTVSKESLIKFAVYGEKFLVLMWLRFESVSKWIIDSAKTLVWFSLTVKDTKKKSFISICLYFQKKKILIS